MARSSVAEILSVVRRRGSGGNEGAHDDKIRMSGTNIDTIQSTGTQSDELGLPIGRTGNDFPYPDNPRGAFVINQDPGDRLQSIANSHLSEGPNPGRIPRQWNSRMFGKVGRGITGHVDGDNTFSLDITGQANGGIGDAKYIQHVQIPRGQTMARAFARSVDDSANIPAVYVTDPTRR